LALRPSAVPTAPTTSFPKGAKTEILPVGSKILRIHHEDNDAIWFGPALDKPPAYRFDATAGQYRVMYAAAAIDGAFAETILHGRTESQIVSRALVQRRAWTELTLQRPLTLMKLYDDGLFWLRTDARISAADDYRAPRKLAIDAYQECPALDGLTYRSRHNNGELCYALFGRVAKSDLSEGPIHLLRDHQAEIDVLMVKYGAVYDTSPPSHRPLSRLPHALAGTLGSDLTFQSQTALQLGPVLGAADRRRRPPGAGFLRDPIHYCLEPGTVIPLPNSGASSP
jgi:hypothetical protein